MSKEPENKMTSGDESPLDQRTREAIGSLPEIKPNEAYRRRLRDDFMTGAILKQDSVAPKRGVSPARVMKTLLYWVAAPAAAAALIAAGALYLNTGPAWTLIAAHGNGPVTIDGHTYQASQLGGLIDEINPGARIVLGDSAEVDIACEGFLAFQLTPGTDIELPERPRRWFDREINTSVFMGEARIVTGADFHGSEMKIYTPEAETKIMGTTIAVIRDSTSTCVCSFDGCVFMAARGDSLDEVPTGMRRFHYNDGRPPETMVIDDLENMKLQMFQDQAKITLHRGS